VIEDKTINGNFTEFVRNRWKYFFQIKMIVFEISKRNSEYETTKIQMMGYPNQINLQQATRRLMFTDGVLMTKNKLFVHDFYSLSAAIELNGGDSHFYFHEKKPRELIVVNSMTKSPLQFVNIDDLTEEYLRFLRTPDGLPIVNVSQLEFCTYVLKVPLIVNRESKIPELESVVNESCELNDLLRV